MGTPVVRYGVEHLRAGADWHAAVSTACAAVGKALTAPGIEPAVLGAVPAAPRLPTIVEHVLARQAAGSGSEALCRADPAERTGGTAGLGARLIGETTATALAAGPVGRV
jgi:hypothetical protein